jgi:hypothetical protein
MASEKLRSENYPVPRFKLEDIQEQNGDFFLSFDFDILEERAFKMSVVRLKQIYNEMVGIEEDKLPKTFRVYLGENFNKKIDYNKTAKKIEQTEQIEKNIYDDDAYNTYGDIKIPDSY